jgi:hypothetical protein
MLRRLRERSGAVGASAFGNPDSARLALLVEPLLRDVLLAALPPEVCDAVVIAVLADDWAPALVDVDLGRVRVVRPLAKAFAEVRSASLDLGGHRRVSRTAAAVEHRAVPASVDMLDMVDLDSLHALGAHLLASFGPLLAGLGAVLVRLGALTAPLLVARIVAVVPLCQCRAEGGSREKHG